MFKLSNRPDQFTKWHTKPPNGGFFVYDIRVEKIMRIMQTSVRDFSFDQKETIKSFFTDAEWDVIDAALCEYQDHFDTDEDSAVLDNVGMKLQSLFGGV